MGNSVHYIYGVYTAYYKVYYTSGNVVILYILLFT